jgi:hypothetical protein
LPPGNREKTLEFINKVMVVTREVKRERIRIKMDRKRYTSMHGGGHTHTHTYIYIYKELIFLKKKY